MVSVLNKFIFFKDYEISGCFEAVWICLDRFAKIWISFDIFLYRKVQIVLDMIGKSCIQVSICFDKLGYVWVGFR